MINNSILCADAQVNYNLDVRVKHEHDRKRKIHEHDNTIEQSGRSMIEMLGVLAIVGVLSVGGIAGYSKAMMQFKINKTIDHITTIATNMRTLFAQQTSYGENYYSGQIGYNMGITPEELVVGEYQNKSVFNGGIEISGEQFTFSDPEMNGKAFSITFFDIPEEACIKLATYDWGSNHSSGLVSVSVHTGAFSTSRTGYIDCPGLIEDGYTTACPGGSVLATPMSVTQAATACQEEGIDFSIKFR